MTPVRETQDMIAGMRPVLRPGLWQFRCVTDPTEAATLLPKALASFREAEALSLILPVTATDEDTREPDLSAGSSVETDIEDHLRDLRYR